MLDTIIRGTVIAKSLEAPPTISANTKTYCNISGNSPVSSTLEEGAAGPRSLGVASQPRISQERGRLTPSTTRPEDGSRAAGQGPHSRTHCPQAGAECPQGGAECELFNTQSSESYKISMRDALALTKRTMKCVIETVLRNTY